MSSQSVSAIDGRMYQASGARWHKRNRREGVIPSGLRNVDTESEWFKSGYRGWVQGYRLVLQGLVFPAPVPLFAAFRANNIGESTIAKQAIEEQKLPLTDCFVGRSNLWRRKSGSSLQRTWRMAYLAETTLEKATFFQTRFV